VLIEAEEDAAEGEGPGAGDGLGARVLMAVIVRPRHPAPRSRHDLLIINKFFDQFMEWIFWRFLCEFRGNHVILVGMKA
jgi:uncharacterized membrane protein (DUF106 family)